MGRFYLHNHGVLYAVGTCPDGEETAMSHDGLLVGLGNPPENLSAPTLPPKNYAQMRHANYPPVTEYLDGLVKGDQAQIDAYIEKCRQVKRDFPKR